MRFFSFLEVELLCHMIVVYLTRYCQRGGAVPFYIPTSNLWEPSLFPTRPQYIILLDFFSGHACGSNIFMFFKVQFWRVPRKVLPPLLRVSMLSLLPAFLSLRLSPAFCVLPYDLKETQGLFILHEVCGAVKGWNDLISFRRNPLEEQAIEMPSCS